ncbi:MAG: DUF3782 domain-containing protein, partial [Chloroflexota bacterium]|nr:DUF3782 domain-containing protein [Chloroflexota bacterium]
AEHSKRMDHFAEVQVEHSKRMDHFAEVQAEHSKRMDHFAEVQAEHSKHIDALREDFNRGFNLLSERMDRGFKRVDAHLGALGARWGTESESAFREGMADILAHETGLRVVNYLEMDPDGVVFDRPDQVEIDVVVQDGTHTLVEIKSSVSRADVAAFARKVKFYEREEGVESTRAIIISPMFAPRAREIAQELGMATFPSVYDVQL